MEGRRSRRTRRGTGGTTDTREAGDESEASFLVQFPSIREGMGDIVELLVSIPRSAKNSARS